MSRRLPPTHWLRAFEASARHLSFTSAAKEMNVTQSAVSQQVKLLEHYLRTPQFHRFPRSLQILPQPQCRTSPRANSIGLQSSTRPGYTWHPSPVNNGLPILPSSRRRPRPAYFGALDWRHSPVHIECVLDLRNARQSQYGRKAFRPYRCARPGVPEPPSSAPLNGECADLRRARIKQSAGRTGDAGRQDGWRTSSCRDSISCFRRNAFWARY